MIASVGIQEQLDPSQVDYADLDDVGGYAAQLQACGQWTPGAAEALVLLARQFNDLGEVILAIGGETNV